MKHGEYQLVEFKATDSVDEPAGLFAALVSVFGNVDRVGDRVLPGAFTKSLERWRASGSPIPVIWSHEHKNPDDYIGSVEPIDVKETPQGLVVAGRFDLQEPKARKIYNLLRRGLVKNWSFGYEVKKARIGTDGTRELSEVDLFEVGPTVIGANGATRTLALKELGELDVAVLERPTEEPEVSEEPVVPTPEPEDPAAPVASKLDPIINQEFTAFEARIDEIIEQKIGRVISAKTEKRIRAALAALQEVLLDGEQAAVDELAAKSVEPTVPTEAPPVSGSEDSELETKSEESPSDTTVLTQGDRLKLDLAQVGSFLSERKR